MGGLGAPRDGIPGVQDRDPDTVDRPGGRLGDPERQPVFVKGLVELPPSFARPDVTVVATEADQDQRRDDEYEP
jgi:hypothetical protein